MISNPGSEEERNYQPTIEFLDLLNEDELPSNSDAVLTMSQFIAAMNKFHSDHYHLNDWDIMGEVIGIE